MWDGGLRVSIGGQRLYGTDENSCEWLVDSIDGIWDGVGSTHEHSSRVWNDGWFANRSARNGRSITLNGYMVCPSHESFEASRQELLAAIGLDDVTLLVDAYGTNRMYRVRQDSEGTKIAVSGYHTWKFSIPLVSLSPYAFDAGEPLTGVTGLPSSSGGMGFPVAFLEGVRPVAPPAGGDGFGPNILDDPDTTGTVAWSWNGLGMGQVDGPPFNHLRLRPGKGWNRLSNTVSVGLGAGARVKLSVRLKGDGLDPNAEVYLGITDMAGAGDEQAVGPVNNDAWKAFEVTCTVPSAANWRFGFTMKAPAGGDSGVLLIATPSMTVSQSSTDVPGDWVFSESTVSGEVALVNPGGAPSPVTLRVDGPVVNPRIEHQPSGGVLELALSLGSGHCVVFDSQSRQVLVDGRDPARGAVIRRGWSDALPGKNSWSLSAKEYSKWARLSVSFRGAYL